MEKQNIISSEQGVAPESFDAKTGDNFSEESKVVSLLEALAGEVKHVRSELQTLKSDMSDRFNKVERRLETLEHKQIALQSEIEDARFSLPIMSAQSAHGSRFDRNRVEKMALSGTYLGETLRHAEIVSGFD